MEHIVTTPGTWQPVRHHRSGAQMLVLLLLLLWSGRRGRGAPPCVARRVTVRYGRRRSRRESNRGSWAPRALDVHGRHTAVLPRWSRKRRPSSSNGFVLFRPRSMHRQASPARRRQTAGSVHRKGRRVAARRGPVDHACPRHCPELSTNDT